MQAQADAFLEETESLAQLLRSAEPSVDYAQPTQFKGWSFDDVLRHLHFWNLAADTSLTDEAGFAALTRSVMEHARDGGSMREAEAALVDGLAGGALVDAWVERARAMAARFAAAEPKQRLKWVGPDMSARSSITARYMETWAHGQELYDALGVVRRNTDHIHNICVLGVNTFGWTFRNRGLDIPEPMPAVHLRAPSSASWIWGEADAPSRIEGTAEAFCQAVTQVRNASEVELEATGEVAKQWLAFAQCFAGPPQDPPAPGTRFTQR